MSFKTPEDQQKYYQEHREQYRAYARKSYLKRRKPPTRQKVGISHDSVDWHKKYRQTKRLDVLTHYSDGVPTCACCGESHIEFLAIDHINGDGNKHRKVRHGVAFYNWLITSGYPDGYRVLCHNCNSSIGFYGYCPHEANV